MACANVYLGLKIGMTVSASIPSAVLSMLILRRMKNSTLGENNLVQTAASAGESLAAGFIFTLPALLLLNIWEMPAYWPSVFICMLGGSAGVFFSAPLRDVLIVREKLKFPEGVATADIIRKGQSGASGGFAIVLGATLAALMKISEAIFRFWRESLEGVFSYTTSGGFVLSGYIGTYTSPALMAVGFIIGLPACLAIFFGALLSWGVLLPLLSLSYGDAPAASVESLYALWSSDIRYVGVGAMLVGSLWTVFSLRSSIVNVLRLVASARRSADGESGEETRSSSSELGQASSYYFVSSWYAALFLLLATALLFYLLFSSFFVASLALALAGVFVFLFSIVSGYMAGVVGSSNNPVSGVTICAVLLAALVFNLFVGVPETAMYVVVCLGAFVCCAAAIAGDNLQDLKAGYILGTDPVEQKVMQFVGVFSASFVLPIVLKILLAESRVGSPGLPAPQASLVAGIVGSLQSMDIPWGMVGCGVWIAVLCILIDIALSKYSSGFRLPVLACAVGLYLPLSLSVGILLGGICAKLRSRYFPSQSSMEFGALLAAGLVTGEALCGILVAALLSWGFTPFAWSGVEFLGALPVFVTLWALTSLRSPKSHVI